MTLPTSILTKNQKTSFKKEIIYHGELAVLKVIIRYDDDCNNGHNSFAITGRLFEKYYQHGEPYTILSNGKEAYLSSCGCLHDLIAEHFPEFKHLLKWHLCSSDGPMHYLANTLYHANYKTYNWIEKGKEEGPNLEAARNSAIWPEATLEQLQNKD